MTALSISDATREHSETDIRDRKSDLANRDHDEEESGVSNGSTTASSVCNSVTSHEHSVLPNNPENNEKLENGKVQLGTGTVNGEVHTADLLRPEVTLNGTENNFISFDLPELHTLNIRPQTEFLLLAWALLVYRNTEGGNDAHFSWSFDDAAKLASNQNKISGETGSSTVVQTLDAIQKLENGFNELARVRADNLKIIIGTVTCSREQTAQVSFGFFIIFRMLFDLYRIVELYFRSQKFRKRASDTSTSQFTSGTVQCSTSQHQCLRRYPRIYVIKPIPDDRQGSTSWSERTSSNMAMEQHRTANNPSLHARYNFRKGKRGSISQCGDILGRRYDVWDIRAPIYTACNSAYRTRCWRWGDGTALLREVDVDGGWGTCCHESWWRFCAH